MACRSWTVDRVLDDVVAEVVGLAVGACRRLMPPPAIHIVKQRAVVVAARGLR